MKSHELGSAAYESGPASGRIHVTGIFPECGSETACPGKVLPLARRGRSVVAAKVIAVMKKVRISCGASDISPPRGLKPRVSLRLLAGLKPGFHPRDSTSRALIFRGNLSLFDVRAFTRWKRARKTVPHKETIKTRGGLLHPAGHSNARTSKLITGTAYTSPWSSMALATFRKPPMLAPLTRLPGVP